MLCSLTPSSHTHTHTLMQLYHGPTCPDALRGLSYRATGAESRKIRKQCGRGAVWVTGSGVCISSPHPPLSPSSSPSSHPHPHPPLTLLTPPLSPSPSSSPFLSYPPPHPPLTLPPSPSSLTLLSPFLSHPPPSPSSLTFLSPLLSHPPLTLLPHPPLTLLLTLLPHPPLSPLLSHPPLTLPLSPSSHPPLTLPLSPLLSPSSHPIICLLKLIQWEMQMRLWHVTLEWPPMRLGAEDVW